MFVCMRVCLVNAFAGVAVYVYACERVCVPHIQPIQSICIAPPYVEGGVWGSTYLPTSVELVIRIATDVSTTENQIMMCYYM